MTFWLGSQVRLDMEIPGDCKLFVWKSVNFTCRKKQKIKKNKNKSNDLEDFTQRLHISLVILKNAQNNFVFYNKKKRKKTL